MPMAPSISVLIRWHTALPIKQAVAKMRFGSEAATAPQAKQMLENRENAYIVGVIGLPMMVLRGDANKLKEAAHLNRKDKEPIMAVDVQAERDPATSRANLYLVFPRVPGSMIEADDKDVEVELKLGRMDIKRKFKLKDMMYEGKLEL